MLQWMSSSCLAAVNTSVPCLGLLSSATQVLGCTRLLSAQKAGVAPWQIGGLVESEKRIGKPSSTYPAPGPC